MKRLATILVAIALVGCGGAVSSSTQSPQHQISQQQLLDMNLKSQAIVYCGNRVVADASFDFEKCLVDHGQKP
jgi:hypothetical protein